jgi:hypothetical protein
MTSWKDALEIKKQSLKLSLQQTGFSLGGFLSDFPPTKRKLLIALLIALVPATILVRLSVQKFTEYRLRSSLVTAHQSFVEPEQPTIGQVRILPTLPNTYAAFAEVANPNLDLAAAEVRYTFTFFNAAGERITSNTGQTFLLPDQKKYLVAPRVEMSGSPVKAELTLGTLRWQKKLSLPEVQLRTAAPIIYEQQNPQSLVAEGAVVNNSPYRLGAIRLVFLVYGQNNQIIAVSQRDEFSVAAYARRAYKLTWPNLYAADVSRIAVFPDVNTLDSQNINLEELPEGDSLSIPESNTREEDR